MSSPLKHQRTLPGRLLVEIDGKAMKIAVGAEAFSIGAEDGASLVLDHPGVSPLHAVIQRDEDRYEIFDLLSATGTFVNGTRVEAALLKTGDALRIGPVRLVFLLDAATAPPPTPPPPLRFLHETVDLPAQESESPTAAAIETADHETVGPTEPPALRPDTGPLVPPRVVRHIRFSDQAGSYAADPFAEVFVLQLRRSPFVLVSAMLHATLMLTLWLTSSPAPPKLKPLPVVATVDAGGFEPADDSLRDEPAPLPEDPSRSVEDETAPEAEPDRVASPEDTPDETATGASEDTGFRIVADGRTGDDDPAGPFRNGGALAGSALRRYADGLRGTGLDVVFVFDATGSMETVLADARARVNDAATVLSALVPQFRLGAVAFRDRGDEFVTKSVKLTRDHYAIVDFLDGLQAGGGGDRPEAVEEALREAVQRMPFQQGSRRIVIVVGDAPPHADGVGAARTIAASLKERNGVLHAVYAAQRGRTEPDAQAFFADLAQRSGGVFLDLAAGGRIVEGVLPFVFGKGYETEMTLAVEDVVRGRRAGLWRRFVEESDAGRVKRELVRRRESTPFLQSALARNPRPEHLAAFLDILADPDADAGNRWLAAVCAKRVIAAAAPPERLAQLASGLKPETGTAMEERIRLVRIAATKIGMGASPLPATNQSTGSRQSR